VISLYDQRCVFCRLKVISYSNENIVDGAHIKPFSTFRDNRYTNGLALCKNHHWAFDRGWFGIDDNYKILIPPDRLVEEPPPQTRSMMNFRGEQILLPQQERFFPDPEALSWHREHWQIPA
jgi:putative restriction endonuclease